MKKIAIIFCLAAIASLALLFEFGRTSVELATDSAATAALSVNPDTLALQRRVIAMSADEKIGQMLMVAIPDTILSSRTADWLYRRHIGGVILLGKNVRTREQTETLIRDLQQKAKDPTDPPLFIAVDQEGGAVSRFLFLDELTAQRDIVDGAQAFEIGKRRGAELKAIGVNINFSPVLDVADSSADFIYSRAFVGDTSAVGALGRAMIRGYRDGGVIAVAKHFPGHGGTATDSHKNLPVVSRNASAAADAVLPFREAVKDNVPMVMAGHIKVLEIDDKYPASLSPAAMAILRLDLGFDGVIITDDFGMGAIVKPYSLADAAVQSVRAGADIVLVVRTVADYNEIYAALKAAVVSGDITETRINQSISRILSLKANYLK